MGLSLGTRRFHVLDIFADRMDTTLQPAKVTEHFALWDPVAVGVETIFYQTDLFKHLRAEKKVRLHEIPRRKGAGSLNKYMRLLSLAERYKSGHVVHPTPRPPWLDAYEDELASINFVNGVERHAHDDMVDAVAMAVSMLSPYIYSDPTPQEPKMVPVHIGF